MKKQNFIMEIGVEDLPARFVPLLIQEVEEYFKQTLRDMNVPYGEISVSGTHRRIVVSIKKIPERRPEKVEIIQGPPEKVAFKNGKPTSTLTGFLKAKGGTLKDVEVRETKKGRYVFVRVRTGGDSVIPHISEMARAMFFNLSLPKSMRWDASGFRFLRPLRYILCLYGNRVVPFKVGNVESGRYTHPDRTRRKKVRVQDASHFIKLMKEHKIELSPVKRQEKIERCIRRFEVKVGGRVPKHIKNSLFKEVIFMTECPGCVLVEFDEKFTSLPPALVTVVLQNQVKSFPFFDSRGRLRPYALFVYDGKNTKKSVVKNGVRQVIRARLEDAEFYFMDDLRTPIDEFVESLKGVNFGENLGTMWERIERISALAEMILGGPGEKIRKASQLMDFDLTTSAVSEFPELHGYMGRIYAEKAGVDAEIARAIEEHIYPRFSGDKVPESELGVALSIADRVESICSHIVAGHRPAADADPFGVRRSAITLSEVLATKWPDVGLEKLIEKALTYFNRSDLKGEILKFLLQRFISACAQKGMRRDLLEASLVSPYNPLTIKMRYDALKSIEKTPLMMNISLAVKRLNNILKDFTSTEYKNSLFSEDGENELHEKLMEVESRLSSVLESREFEKALKMLGELSDVLDMFFQKVFVMVEDPLVRNNRLSLLNAVRKVYNRVAHFSSIEISG